VSSLTEVLSVRVKKSPKDEAEKKAKAQKVAKELSSLMDVEADEWVKDVKAARHEMYVPHWHLFPLPLLISGKPFSAEECAVSSLIEYEIGNVLWREN